MPPASEPSAADLARNHTRDAGDFNAFLSVLAAIRGIPLDEDESTTWCVFLDALLDAYGFRMAWYGMYHKGEIRPQQWAGHADRYLDGLVLTIREPTSPDARCAMSQAVLTGTPFGYADLAHDEGFRQWRDYALELGYASNLALPLIVNDQTEGGIMVYAGTPQAFPANRAEHLRQLAEEMARILSHRRRHRQTMDTLRQSEELYRALVESAGEAIFCLTRDGTFSFMNNTAAQQLGGRPEDYVGHSLHDCFPTEVAQRHHARVKEVIDTQVPYVGMVPSVLRNQTRWFRTSIQPLRDARGAVTSALLIARDITEHRAAEEALQESEAKYRILVERANDGICIVQDEVIQFANQPCARLVGHTVEALTGKPFAPFIDPQHRDAVVGRYRRHHAEQEAPESYETALLHREGHSVPVELTAMRIPYGGQPASLVYLHDLTVRKQTEEALIRSERLAAVGTLAGGVAHEFNNINVSILGFSQLALERDDLDEELRDWLQRIYRGAQRASEITRNLLSFSRPQEGDRHAVSLGRVVDETVSLVQREFETEGLTLTCRHQPAPDNIVDAGQIGQVVLNLLINARHAVLGQPECRVDVETGLAGERLFIRVRDTGCGIPPEQLGQIFTPFFSTKGEHAPRESRQAQVRGTGLGLSVSHTIAADHGGTIEVESTPGRGSTFTLWLPMNPAGPPAASAAAQAAPATAAATVLILDDEADTRDFLRLLLERHGHRVRVTAAGQEALEMVAKESIDLVLVDLQMPLMDGLVFLKTLREAPTGHQPATVVMTGRSLPATQEEFSALGVAATVEKPFDLDTTIELIHRVLRQQRSAMATAD